MKRLFALFVCTVLLLSAAPTFALADGGILRVGTDAEPIGFDPHTISAVASARVMTQLYNQLVDVDGDLNVVPELAESWEQPDDTTYIFHLRGDVTFHNGRSMTAEDVKYSFERILDPNVGALGSSASYAGDIESIEIIDDLTVKFTLKQINAPFLASLSSWYCSIVAKEAVEENGDLLSADGGTGPFTLGEWIPDNMVSINKYDGYFIPDQPKVDGIEFYVMTDSSARLAALRTGSVDLIAADTSMLPLVAGDANINTLSYQSRNYAALCLNTTLPQFSDVRVRQAISLALNRQDIIDLAYNGEAEVSGFVPASLGHWAVDVTEHPLYQQDIEKAKALMSEAGYADGFEVTLIVGLLDSLRDIGAVAQQQLAEIGITVNVVNKENAEYVALWSAHDFEIMACQNGAGSDPSRGVAFFFKTGNSANIAGYSNARVDELCELGAGTTDVAQREEYYKEAIEIILDEEPNVVIASPREYFLSSAKLLGFEPSAAEPYSLATAYLAE
ncbi:MAG: ABC transporter substrate-binding protein [Oscillospiraceae bacterium]|jgi:peptide/nickel transport system substrate-binding protein|nr:ABC transporter substrate-binding protein [Oscillospiraceae bacterium]